MYILFSYSTRIFLDTNVVNWIHQEVGYEEANIDFQNLYKMERFSNDSIDSISWRIGWSKQQEGIVEEDCWFNWEISLCLLLTIN